MSGERSCFGGHPLHEIAVRDNGVDSVVEYREVGRIETRGEMAACDGHSDAVAEALPQRPRSRFDTRSVAILRMTRRLAVPLTELL